jgi:small subunit ribosomal protein S1
MTSQSTRSQEPSAPFSMDDFAKALEQHDYQFEKGQVVRGKVFQHTSEGAYVDIGGKSSGFVPLQEASSSWETSLAEALPLEAESEFLIISDQNAEGEVKLSRRQLELQRAWEQVTEIAETGKAVEMRVTGTNKGGVVGDVEGLRGFIPRSHLMEKDDLESLVGQLLLANFLEVNRDDNKLVLSQRQIARAAAISQLQEGTLMAGKVVKIQPYGVFVQLDGVTGLLHIKQVSGAQIHSLTSLFEVGQEIKVVVAQIDEYKNRISLSTKLLENYPGEILEKFEEVMATASERIEQAKEKLAETVSVSGME